MTLGFKGGCVANLSHSFLKSKFCLWLINKTFPFFFHLFNVSKSGKIENLGGLTVNIEKLQNFLKAEFNAAFAFK